MMTGNDNTFYRPGETFLHKVDPRLKLGACLLVVVVIFAAGSWLQLVLPLIILLFALFLLAPLPSTFWRVCWMLRWLVLFTLLMHVLFTDGRTLLGMSWLSLDGLYNGLQVCVQMLMAVSAAAVLSLTTSVEELVAALGWFVSPFRWLGCQTEEWQKILLLAVNMLPVVHDEIKSVKESGKNDESKASDAASRWLSVGSALKVFVDRLLNKGDEVAHELAADENVGQSPVALPGLLPLTLQDQLLVASCVLLVLAFWLVGM